MTERKLLVEIKGKKKKDEKELGLGEPREKEREGTGQEHIFASCSAGGKTRRRFYGSSGMRKRGVSPPDRIPFWWGERNHDWFHQLAEPKKRCC